MLSGLLASFLPSIVGKFFESGERIWTQYIQKEITKEQLLTELQKALLAAVVEVERAHADAIKATFASFMGTVASTPIVARAYVTVLLAQCGVLVWVQVGVPFLSWMTGADYPSAGTTIDWAYALVAGLCGLGPLVMKTTPADLKKLIGK